MKEKGPFKYMGAMSEDGLGTGEVSVYQADFSLPDDGCPDSQQALRVKVIIEDDEKASSEIRLSVMSSNGAKETSLGSFSTMGFEGLSRLLYGVARVVTVKKIEPV